MFRIILSFLFLLSVAPVQAVDLAKVEAALKGEGLVGEVHGAVPEHGLYVFTVREADFFTHAEFPITTESELIRQQLGDLHRHDRVKIKGRFLDNHAPIQHISVTELEMVKKSDVDTGDYPYAAKLPEDLEGKSELVGKVHAVANEGKILVIEYKDAVIPVFLRDAQWTKTLFRNDKIRIHYVLRKFPTSPTHVMLNPKVAKPVEVLDSIQAWHGKPGTVEGNLVMFPKSPQVKFNVFAIQVPDEAGFHREFTLLNFEKEIFDAILEKLEAVWKQFPETVIPGRNKFVNTGMRMRATGTFNVVDAGQANPQVILAGPEALTLVP